MTPLDAADEVLDRAEAALDQGRAHDALRLTEEMLAVDPLHAGGWFVRGDTLLVLGDLVQAADAFHRAAQLHPGHAASWSSHARVSVELLRIETAKASVARALEADPDCAEAWWVRSLVAEWQGDRALVRRARAEAAVERN